MKDSLFFVMPTYNLFFSCLFLIPTMIFNTKDPKGIFSTELVAHQLFVESMYVGYLRSVMTWQILMYLLHATSQEA
jgi:hypothetical protein